MCECVCVCFFFFKQKTAYDMRIMDWSSDVCSSDLRTIHRLVDQGALDRMERRVQEKPDLMTIRRYTVEHPFGTIKRMSGGGRFLTRGLRRVKAEADRKSVV